MMDCMVRVPCLLLIAAACLAPASGGEAGSDQPAKETPHRQQLVDALKDFEAQSGFRPTGNFAHGDPRVPAYLSLLLHGAPGAPGLLRRFAVT